MTNMTGDMAETSVTDFFTLPKFGRVWAGPPVYGPDHALKVVESWLTDRVEVDAYDNGLYLVWSILYIQK